MKPVSEVWIQTDTDREAVEGLQMAVEQIRLASGLILQLRGGGKSEM